MYVVFELCESAFLGEEACDSELCVRVEVHVCCPPLLALGEDVSAEDKACNFPRMFLSLMFSTWMFFLKILLLRKLQDATLIFIFDHYGTTEERTSGVPDLPCWPIFLQMTSHCQMLEPCPWI